MYPFDKIFASRFTCDSMFLESWSLKTSDKDDQAKERAQSAQEGYQASQDTLMSDFVSWAYN